jgi:hypothetical protein
MFVLGFIDEAEFDFLNTRVSTLKAYKKKALLALARKETKHLKEGKTEQFLFDRKEEDDVWIYSNPNEINGSRAKKHSSGPVEKTIDQLRKFLMARSENPRDVRAKTDSSALTGYIYDRKADRLFPNFTEIERRKNLYEEPVTLKEERELKEYLKNLARNWKSKKQEL